MKRCPRCQVEQPVTEYHRDRSRKDGLKAYCKTCSRELLNQWQAANPEKLAARQARHYAGKGRETQRRWKAANADRQAGYKATYRAKNPDESRIYYEANKAESHLRVLKRRAIKRAATIGPIDLDALWLESGGICALCATAIDPELRGPHAMSRSVDHIIPLSRGGMHEQSNLQWTHLVCNKRKGATVPSTDSGRAAAPTQGSGSHHC